MEETIDTSSEQSLLDTGADSTNADSSASSQPAAETPTQPSTGWVNPDGTFGDKWLDALPEDAKDYKDTLSKYKSVPDMAKALANANALIGKKLGVPSEKSSPEDKDRTEAWIKQGGGLLLIAGERMTYLESKKT